MIFTILIWFYIFLVTTISGHLLYRICCHLIKAEIQKDPSFTELSVFGIICIGIFVSYFSIISKTGLLSNNLIVTIDLIYFYLKKDEIISYFKRQIQKLKGHSYLTKSLLFIYLLLMLFAAQQHPTVSDTGLYHAQFIQWLSNFRIVPGLGNLNGRFAFNNQSFLLEALFSFSFLKLTCFHLLNSYLLLTISVSLILAIKNLTTGNQVRSILYAGLLVLLQIFYLVTASSPTPDIFSSVGIWFIVMIYLEKTDPGSNREFYWIVILLTSFFLITVKLSTLPLILLVLLYFQEAGSSKLKKMIIVACIGSAVFIPYFLRNYFISGYLVYPYPFINIFNPDWKIPVSYVQEMKSVIATHAQSGDWQVRQFSEWLPIWFSNRSAGFRILSVSVILSPFLLIAIITFQKHIRKLFKFEFRILSICLLAIIFWFFSAPNYRFIYGFLFVYILIIVLILSHLIFYELKLSDSFCRFREKFIRSWFPFFVYTLIIICPLFYFTKFNYNELGRSIVSPVEYREVEIRRMIVNNVQVGIPVSGEYCWNATLPCSFFQNNIGITNIELRGIELKDGFRVKSR